MVLDASAVVAWLLRLEHAEAIDARLLGPDVSLHAPHLLDVEVAQVVRRLDRAGRVDENRGQLALEALADLDVARYPHEPFLPSIWRMRANLTAYDATYVALAEALEAPLVTLDRRLAAAPGHRVEVDLIA